MPKKRRLSKKQRRSAAALKGWKTRRAQARARSAAALKGWETRRAKAQARKRKLPTIEKIIKITSTRKARRGGGHLTLLDMRAIVPRKMSDAAILENIRRAATGEPTEKGFNLKFISWKHGEQGALREGTEDDLQNLAGIVLDPANWEVREAE